jgi:hypothetical protein
MPAAAGGKSDSFDSFVLGELARTDSHRYRPVWRRTNRRAPSLATAEAQSVPTARTVGASRRWRPLGALSGSLGEAYEATLAQDDLVMGVLRNRALGVRCRSQACARVREG